jgi:AcrR family transcriptional regulator
VPRARPLSAEDRRREIAAAAVPLFAEYGFGVSTRQLAEAAGVAEGTLYRVFPTKQHIIRYVVEDLLDPERLIAELATVELTADLVERLDRAVVMLLSACDRMKAFMAAIHASGLHASGHAFRRGEAKEALIESRAVLERRSADLVAALGRLLAPDADRLTVPVEAAAVFIRGAVWVAWMPMPPPLARAAPYDSAILRDPDVLRTLIRGALLAPDPPPRPKDRP